MANITNTTKKKKIKTGDIQGFNTQVQNIVNQVVQIVDNLTSQDTTKALSANQGKQLKDLIDQVKIDVAALQHLTTTTHTNLAEFQTIGDTIERIDLLTTVLESKVDAKMDETTANSRFDAILEKFTKEEFEKILKTKPYIYIVSLNWNTEASVQLDGWVFEPYKDFFSYNIVWDAEDEVEVTLKGDKIICTAARPSKAKCYVLLTRTNFTT